MKSFKSHIKEAKDTYCSDECCGADVKAEDCDCSADCPHCNCNAIDEAGCSSSKKTVKEAGLWDNIHAKRKRIKNGSGEKMKKPGSKGAPTDQDFKDASESVELDEMSPADKKRISQMYDKKGNLTPLGKKVMDHGKKAADAKVADKARRKEYNAYQKSKRNEEAELEEAPARRNGKKGAPKMTGDSIAIQRAKDAEHNAAMGRTKTGRKKPVRTMTSTQKSLASMRRESDEALDEAQIKFDHPKVKKVSKGFSGRKEAERHNDQLVGSSKASQKSYVLKHKDNKFYVVDMKESVDEDTINNLTAAYINENNIDLADIENMTEEELNEFIGKAIGGAVKLGAKAVIGTARLAGRGAKRAVTTKQGSFRGTKAAKQDKAGDRAEKMAKKREAEAKRAERIRNAQDRSDAADARLSDLKKNKKNK